LSVNYQLVLPRCSITRMSYDAKSLASQWPLCVAQPVYFCAVTRHYTQNIEKAIFLFSLYVRLQILSFA